MQLHETLNLYISNQSYVFEPSSAPQASHTPDGPTLLNEKDARETLHIDRRTGQMTLNGKLHSPASGGQTKLMDTLSHRRDRVWQRESHFVLRHSRYSQSRDQ